MRRLGLIIPALVVLLVILFSAIFIVDERQKALVLQFGQIKQVRENPGLYLKIPLIQEVVYYDDRILSLDTPTIEVTPSDERRLVVDAFARYRISDVVRFRQAVGSGGTRAAEDRLSGILNATIRQVLGSAGVTSNTILSSERSELMSRIQMSANARGEALGIDVVDVRLKQTNLPAENLDATFARMRAEREREAADEIARGEEAALRVRALADRTVVELVSDASRESEIARGEADALRNSIFAQAFGADPEFFEFYRSMAAYERALQGDNSTLVITPDSEFFEYLGGSRTGDIPAPFASTADGQARQDAATAAAGVAATARIDAAGAVDGAQGADAEGGDGSAAGAAADTATPEGAPGTAAETGAPAPDGTADGTAAGTAAGIAGGAAARTASGSSGAETASDTPADTPAAAQPAAEPQAVGN